MSIDINGYKESRYKKMASMSKKMGKQVLRSKVDVKLDPLPADERKVIHQVIADMDSHLKTESKGEGKNRFITISYVKQNSLRDYSFFHMLYYRSNGLYFN